MRCIQNWMKLGPQIVITVYFHKCCGSVTVWYRYGSGPRISTSVKRIQIRLLLFPSVNFKVATKLLKVFLLITYFLKLHLERPGAESVPCTYGSGARRP